jgi:hypothetical protein
MKNLSINNMKNIYVKDTKICNFEFIIVILLLIVFFLKINDLIDFFSFESKKLKEIYKNNIVPIYQNKKK